jgi:HEAT repeat protein
VTIRPSSPGPVEHDVRARGHAWAAAIARYAVDHRSAPAEVDRDKRRAAARLLADLAPPSTVGELIALLADDDGDVRYHAAAALNRLTGQTLGFPPDVCAATPRDAAPAVAWQEWWARNRSRYPARP